MKQFSGRKNEKSKKQPLAGHAESNGHTAKKNGAARPEGALGAPSFGMLIAKGLPMDILFLLLTSVLLIIGLIMVFSASFVSGYYVYDDSYYYIKRQLGFAVIGVVIMFITSKVNYNFWRFFAYALYAVSLVLLVLVLFIGDDDGEGVTRWITILGIRFQPSEIAKLGTTMCLALYMSVNYNKMKTFLYGIIIPGVIILVPVLLIFAEPHLSGAILVFAVSAILIFVGGASMKYIVPMVGAAVTAAVAIVLVKKDYMLTRLQTWLDPFSDPLGDGYQTIQSLLAIGSGGLFGLGLGRSRQKHLYLPESHNDYIFAILCEELGFIGAIFILILFAMLIYRGFQIAYHSMDRFGFFLAVGIVARIALQTILNIAVVTNTIPPTGISLPFFSSGGTSLVILLFEIGIVLSISRYSNINKNKK